MVSCVMHGRRVTWHVVKNTFTSAAENDPKQSAPANLAGSFPAHDWGVGIGSKRTTKFKVKFLKRSPNMVKLTFQRSRVLSGG